MKEKFMTDILGERLLITIEAEGATLTVEANAEIITDEFFLIGDNNFSMSIDKSSTFTKEDDKWIVKTPKNLVIIITVLDKIR